MLKEYKGLFPEITLNYRKGTMKRFKISSSKDTEDVLRRIMNGDTLEIQEEFVVIFLNNANNSVGWIRLSVGGMTGTLVDIRLLMVTALQCGASSVILSHNHPSGNLKPSKADKDLTRKIVKAGDTLDIRVLDHIIITDESYFSFSDEGLI